MEWFGRLAPQESTRWNFADGFNRLGRLLDSLKDASGTEPSRAARRGADHRELLEAMVEGLSATYEALRFADARMHTLEATSERARTPFYGWENELAEVDVGEHVAWIERFMSGIDGRVWIGDAPSVALVDLLSQFGSSRWVVDVRAATALRWAEHDVEVAIDRALDSLARTDARSLAAVVLTGCTDRESLGDASMLLEAAQRALRPGGRLVALGSVLGAAQGDALGRRPPAQHGWEALLAHRGFSRVETTESNVRAYGVTGQA